MKNTYYSSKEQFERLHPYVTVIFSEYQPACIEKSFTSRKNGETAQVTGKVFGNLMTRKQSVKQIKEWNEKYFPEIILA